MSVLSGAVLTRCLPGALWKNAQVQHGQVSSWRRNLPGRVSRRSKGQLPWQVGLLAAMQAFAWERLLLGHVPGAVILLANNLVLRHMLSCSQMAAPRSMAGCGPSLPRSLVPGCAWAPMNILLVPSCRADGSQIIGQVHRPVLSVVCSHQELLSFKPSDYWIDLIRLRPLKNEI